MKNQKKAYYYAIAAILCWSTVAVAFKTGLSSITTIQLVAISCYTSIVILFTYLLSTRKLNELKELDKGFIVKSALFGLLNPFLYYLILFKAYTLLPAQIAQPLNYVWPLILVVLSIIFLKQKISLKAILGIVVSFSGVIIISFQGNFSFADIKNPAGIIYSTGSSLIWASYWLLNTSRDKYEETGMFLNFIFAGIYITILMFAVGGFSNLHIKGVAAAIYIGLFEMGLTFILWLKALKLSKDTGKVSHLVYFSPFISLLFINLILKEFIYFTTYIGLVLIIAGVILSKLKKRPKQQA
ncbi:MAG TPA: DMT family transporter [Bacteroidales bacterium]|nr:DMT family transporter [Bacteroidales bacterium]